MELFDAERFGEWLTSAFQRSKFKTQSDLAKASGITRAYVSSLMRSGKQGLTDKPSQPGADKVIALAKALGEDVNMALMIAGHAPLEIDNVLFYRGNQLSEDARREVLNIIHRINNGTDEPK